MSDEGDAVTLALLAGVTFRKYATHNGPHWFYDGEPGYSFGMASMPARTKQQAAETWLRRYETRINRREQ